MIEYSKNEIDAAVRTLERLVNHHNDNILSEITRYKTQGQLDKFTLYRINRKLREIEKSLC
ncbi:MAG TPA: hypothetical protein H9673_06400 [Candidatus Adamsella sp.]|nr:hypothetical protein [Candidatus Adamsella sp.]